MCNVLTYLYFHVAPTVKRFRALRVNNTAFNITLEVFYTGGGAIKQFSIESGSSAFVFPITATPIQSQTSSRLWYTIIIDPAFDGLEEPKFNITVINAMELSIVQQVQGEIGKSIRYHGVRDRVIE